jgi:hypothetical protein
MKYLILLALLSTNVEAYLTEKEIVENYCIVETIEHTEDAPQCASLYENEGWIELCYCMKDTKSAAWKLPWENKK